MSRIATFAIIIQLFHMTMEIAVVQQIAVNKYLLTQKIHIFKVHRLV